MLEIIVELYFDSSKLYLEYCIQLYVLHFKWDVEELEWVQRKVTSMINSLKTKLSELKELTCFTRKRKGQGKDTIAVSLI